MRSFCACQRLTVEVDGRGVLTVLRATANAANTARNATAADDASAATATASCAAAAANAAAAIDATATADAATAAAIADATGPASDAPPSLPAVSRDQATLSQLNGVASAAEQRDLSDSLGVSSALYLGASDTLRLRAVLEQPKDQSHALRVLRRLSMVPMTLKLEETTGIAAFVAELQADETVCSKQCWQGWLRRCRLRSSCRVS